MASETITHPDGATHPDDGAPQAPGDLPLPTGTAGPMPAPPEKDDPEEGGPPADEPLPAAEEIARIVESRHDQPHRVLGPHRSACGTATVVRAYLPQARRVTLRTPGATPEACPMRRIHALGLFQARVAQPFDPSALHPLDYVLEIEDDGGARYTVADPYRFRAARFSADDEALFTHGRHLGLTGLLGAHPGSRNGVAGVEFAGVEFAVWAPGAARVSVVGGFNGWDGRRHPMQRVSASGIWELFIPGVAEGDLYKFEIKTPADAVFLKPDPFAMRSEPPAPGRHRLRAARPAGGSPARRGR
jgi:1,4-alpha-glucan branching enzyme